MNKLICSLSTVILALLVIAGNALAGEKMGHSGYLGDEYYAKLKKVELPSGEKAKQWISSALNPDNYHSVMIDSVVYYPQAEPSAQVSSSTLSEISDYLTHLLKQKVGSKVTLVDEAGPGVARLRVALTAVVVKKEGLSAFDVVPVHLLFTGIKNVAGKENYEVVVYVEGKVLDSVSGEYLGAFVRKMEGEKLKGKKQKLRLHDLQAELNKAGVDAAGTMDKMVE